MRPPAWDAGATPITAQEAECVTKEPLCPQAPSVTGRNHRGLSRSHGNGDGRTDSGDFEPGESTRTRRCRSRRTVWNSDH